MSKVQKCRRCRMPAPDPEHLYERSDGKWFCMPCLVLLVYESEVVAQNRAMDEVMEAHRNHERLGTFAGCPLCAIGV